MTAKFLPGVRFFLEKRFFTPCLLVVTLLDSMALQDSTADSGQHDEQLRSVDLNFAAAAAAALATVSGLSSACNRETQKEQIGKTSKLGLRLTMLKEEHM